MWFTQIIFWAVHTPQMDSSQLSFWTHLHIFHNKTLWWVYLLTQDKSELNLNRGNPFLNTFVPVVWSAPGFCRPPYQDQFLSNHNHNLNWIHTISLNPVRIIFWCIRRHTFCFYVTHNEKKNNILPIDCMYMYIYIFQICLFIISVLGGLSAAHWS